MKVVAALLFSAFLAILSTGLLYGQGLAMCVIEGQLKTTQSCSKETPTSFHSSIDLTKSEMPSRTQLRLYGLAGGIVGTGLSLLIIPEISPIVGTIALVETIHLTAGQHGNLLGEFLVATGILAAAIGGGVAVGLATGSNEAAYAMWGAGVVLQDFVVVSMELKHANRSHSAK